MEYKQIGHGKPIRDAVQKVTGQAHYTADLNFPRMLYGKILLSPIAHGRIKSIDTSKAEALPGVNAVATYLKSPQGKFNSAKRFFDHQVIANEMIFSDVVRYVGDRVAAVAAIDEATATKALKLIEVEYEEFPAIFDPEEALKDGAKEIHPGGNKVGEINIQAGDVDKAWDEADYIFEDKYNLPAIHHGAIERFVTIGYFDATSKMTIWSGTQNTFAIRVILCKLFDLPMNKVRIIKPTLGGAFGGKLEMNIECVAALLARMTGCHVKVELSRKDCMLARTRHGGVITVKTGVKKDGTLVAHDMNVILNTGAYASSAMNVAGAMGHKPFKMFKLANLRFKAIPAYTNLPIAGAMRGYGSTQVFYAQQLQFNRICNELKLDMVDFLNKNLVEPDSLEPVHGQPLGNPRPLDCLNRGAAAFNWDDKELSTDNGRFKRGIGVAAGCHGNGVFSAHRDSTTLTIKMNEDGTAVLYSGTHDMGTGSITTQVMIIAEILGIDDNMIEVVESDTDLVPWNLGDYASRATFVSGNAAKKVAINVRNQILAEASQMLETPIELLEIEDSIVFNVEKPEIKASLSDVLIYVQKEKQSNIVGTETYASEFGPYSYGVDFAEVEVDTETGEVRVLNFVAAHDVGKAINPTMTEGQIEGAIMQGIGYALTEELTYDDKGRLDNGSFKRYGMPKITSLPATKVLLVEENEESGPFGAKSIGECSLVPVAPAVANAVCNALGMNLHDYPLTPKRILEALGK